MHATRIGAAVFFLSACATTLPPVVSAVEVTVPDGPMSQQGYGGVDETHQGTLAPGDELFEQRPNRFADRYTFQTMAGYFVSITLESPTFDTYLFLLGPNGEMVMENDDDTGTNSRMTGIVPMGGQFTVVCTSYTEQDTGDYTLVIHAAPAPPDEPGGPGMMPPTD